jgi:hypothetical protein
MHEQSINPKNLQGQVKDASLPISGHSVPNVSAQPKQLPTHSFKISLKDRVYVTRTTEDRRSHGATQVANARLHITLAPYSRLQNRLHPQTLLSES